MNIYGRDKAFAQLNKTIAPGDGMFREESVYFSVGASAMDCIMLSLTAARKRPDSVHRILDYACGYGRVLRWLKAEFPSAYLLGVDADPKAASAAGSVLNVETHPLDVSLANPLGESFDLIWVGSLFTHLPEAESARVLAFLRDHLNPGGVLVFTTHGALVESRIRSGERNYGLSIEGVESLLRLYDASGYGFASYPKQSGYGISIMRTSHIAQMCETAKLTPVCFRSQGWAGHQDMHASQR
ncbi:bifunctional 2-polyprenyl-6-hydroxyphenol methylase/3-demethylubiquinol 3-O-methyltransferase UbiG [Mesorhizobium sp. J428]|uniref:class I SAM-dependent methyltransferase n=1 Tax=Mesorhizobium sp. J428 TaxID=2898440 RepID=UPI00215198EC|nr:class I SAM-dependent methyltransferase [Mesorhizobium sp. J428]MCR5858301.1 class I SAM-dependent methyltransferase [Mesorhizobium sp. J428]